MNLLYKNRGDTQEGYRSIISSQNSPLKHLEVGRCILSGAGDRWSGQTGDREKVLNILQGSCTVGIRAQGEDIAYDGVGSRRDPFEGRPTMVYIPRDCTYSVVSRSPDVDIVVQSAPARDQFPPRLVQPEGIVATVTGRDNWLREVRSAIGTDVRTGSLIAGETLVTSGNWASYPPHKHDVEDPPRETVCEEAYLFLFRPPNGFGFIRVYSRDETRPLNEAYVLANGDAVALPWGYHPVVTAPGYEMLYLYALAGEGCRLGAWSEDPDHEWILG